MTVTDTTLDGWFKNRYEDKGRKVIPQFSIVSQDIRFGEAERLGNKFIFNVRLRRAHGITFYGSGLDAFTLNAAVSGQTADGEQQGSQIVIREAIAYGVIANAQTSKEAFGNAFDEVVMDMRDTAAFYREMCMLYGGSSIGTLEVDPGSSGGTTRTFTITKATWAPGLWAQMEGAKVDVYSAPGGTHRNPTTAITVSAINFTARTMTATGLDAELTAILINEVIIPYGADGTWFSGFDTLITSTAGTLHNISSSTYGMWLGNTLDAGGGELTFKTIQDAATQIFVRTGQTKLCCYVSPYSYTDLNADLAALRRFTDEGTSMRKLGTTGITYYGVTGDIVIKPHPMVKAGQAFLVATQFFKRVGSTDITFRLPGLEGEGQQPRFFRELADSAGFEIRCYWNQALVNLRPPAHCKISNIVNSGL